VPVRRGIYVGLGATLDDPPAQIDAAIAALEALPGTRVVARSPLYASPAWGPVPQPAFVTAVVELESVLAPHELLDAMLAIERNLGRDRHAGAIRYGPRRIDLDLLVHGKDPVDAPGLHVPHPLLAERAFVLVPLAAIAPDLEVPGHGRVHELLARLEPAERGRVTVLEPGAPRGE
jgi:2-amino-4-hydroxy-6-hydroxymethyldihydropteridine diphosphokinase